MKRIALLIATNLAVVILLSVVIQLFGIDNYLTAHGRNTFTGLRDIQVALIS